MEPLIGIIGMFAFNFPPKGWEGCNGQILPISGNQALFALIGVRYGGNGTTTFALPDLRGRTPIGWSITNNILYLLGDRPGAETTKLIQSNLPNHTHSVLAYTKAGDATSPEGALLANTGLYDGEYKQNPTQKVTMNGTSVSFTGGTQSVSIMQPYLVINFCIAVTGIFPSRN